MLLTLGNLACGGSGTVQSVHSFHVGQVRGLMWRQERRARGVQGGGAGGGVLGTVPKAKGN